MISFFLGHWMPMANGSMLTMFQGGWLAIAFVHIAMKGLKPVKVNILN